MFLVHWFSRKIDTLAMPIRYCYYGKIMANKKDHVGLFKKGTSGNPAGRPKEIAYLREICRARTDEAIATLIEVMRDKKAPPASRTLAANSILDRGYGKPTTVIEGSGILPIIDISDAARRIAFAINQAIDAGEEIEGDFMEVLPIAAPKPVDSK